MSWTEKTIAAYLARHTFQTKCLVMVPNCSWTGHECDLLAVTQNLRVIDVEIKISRSDFRADRDKDKWWRYLPWEESPGWPPKKERIYWPGKVWKHYYCLPEQIWTPEMAAQTGSPNSGVLLLRQRKYDWYVHVERMAKPNRDADKLGAEDAIDIARLASLRMWDAYASAEKADAALKQLRETATA